MTLGPLPSLAIEPSLAPRLRAPYRLQWEDAQKAFVLLYPQGTIKLNSSAGEVLSRCTGKASIQSIIEDLSQEYPNADTIEGDVLQFVAEAFDRRWLEL